MKDKSLADLDNLPDPDVLAEEIAENLESALASFQQVLASLRGTKQSAVHSIKILHFIELLKTKRADGCGPRNHEVFKLLSSV